MKKLFAILLAAIMMVSMCATAMASEIAGTYDITVWVAEKIVDLTKQQIENFNAQKDSPNGKKTMRAYLWMVCDAELG